MQLRRVLAAAKAAGVKWFIPSEFGFDLDKEGKGGALGPLYDPKIDMREAVRKSGLDYTFFNSVSTQQEQKTSNSRTKTGEGATRTRRTHITTLAQQGTRGMHCRLSL